MTMEMILLTGLMILTAVASFAFALKMSWNNLREETGMAEERSKKEIVRFGNGTVFSSNR